MRILFILGQIIASVIRIRLNSKYPLFSTAVILSHGTFEILVVRCFIMAVALSPTVQEFDDGRDADDAVYDLNGKSLCGERYTVFFV